MDYNKLYSKYPNIWGLEPNSLLKTIAKNHKNGTFLDLGSGQGRDAIWMLKQGYFVTALDNSERGLKNISKAVKDQRCKNESITIIHSNIEDFHINTEMYDIIQAFNSLQFISKDKALTVVENMKSGVQKGGYIIISGFTTKDALFKKYENDVRCFFAPNELENLFSNFNIILYEEKIKNDPGHPGFEEQHTHALVRIIAQKT